MAMRPSELDPRVTELEETLKALVSGDRVNGEFSDNQIGKFRIDRILGCHGQAVVIQATDPDLDRKVALKVYHSAVSGQHRKRMLNEGRALARIQSPNVANCYGVEEFDECLFLVNEFIEGETLRTHLDEERLTVDQRLNVLYEIAIGLNDIHSAGLLHRDLKPENIVITPKGNVKIIDFGLVGPLDSVDIPDHDSSGTPAYMAPERARGDQKLIDHRSDIFSVGAMLYEMLTGAPPFDCSSNTKARQLASKNEFVPLKADIGSTLPGRLCMDCLSEDPEQRPEDAESLAARLSSIVGPAESSSRARQFTVLGLIAGLILVASWFALSRGNSPEPAKASVATNTPTVPRQNRLHFEIQKIRETSRRAIAYCRDGEFQTAADELSESVELASGEEIREFLFDDTVQLQKEIQEIANFDSEKRSRMRPAFMAISNARLRLADPVENQEKTKAILKECEQASRTLTDTFGPLAMTSYLADYQVANLKKRAALDFSPELFESIAKRRLEATSQTSESHLDAIKQTATSLMSTIQLPAARKLASDYFQICAEGGVATASFGLRFLEIEFMSTLYPVPAPDALHEIANRFSQLLDDSGLSEDAAEQANVKYFQCAENRVRKNFDLAAEQGRKTIELFGQLGRSTDRDNKLIYLYQTVAYSNANFWAQENANGGDPARLSEFKEKAEKSMLEASKIVDASRDSAVKSQHVTESSFVSQLMGDLETAYQHLLKAKSLSAKPFDGEPNLVQTENNLIVMAYFSADKYVEQKEQWLKKALGHFYTAWDESQKLNDSSHDRLKVVILKYGMKTLLKLEQIDEAAKYLPTAVAICKRNPAETGTWKTQFDEIEYIKSFIVEAQSESEAK